MKVSYYFTVSYFGFKIVYRFGVYGSIYLDKDVYMWTDKVEIKGNECMVGMQKMIPSGLYISDHELDSYKLSKAGNGLYTGEIILTGFLHDVDGDGEPDTNPRTQGNGSNNGFLESGRDGGITILMEFADGGIESKSAKNIWNEGNISLDMPNYEENGFAKLAVNDPDMNLNPRDTR